MDIVLGFISTCILLVSGYPTVNHILKEADNLIEDICKVYKFYQPYYDSRNDKIIDEHSKDATEKYQQFYTRATVIINAYKEMRAANKKKKTTGTLTKNLFFKLDKLKKELGCFFILIYFVDADSMLLRIQELFIEKLKNNKYPEWNLVRDKNAAVARKEQCIRTLIIFTGVCYNGIEFKHQEAVKEKFFNIKMNNESISVTADTIYCKILCKGNVAAEKEEYPANSLEHTFLVAIDAYIFMIGRPRKEMNHSRDVQAGSSSMPLPSNYSFTQPPHEIDEMHINAVFQNMEVDLISIMEYLKEKHEKERMLMANT